MEGQKKTGEESGRETKLDKEKYTNEKQTKYTRRYAKSYNKRKVEIFLEVG